MANEDKTVEQLCEDATNPKHTCKQCDFTVCPSINALIGHILAAHKREIEIASKYSAEHEARTFDAIRKRDALINEMTIALSGSLDIVSNVSEFLSLDCGTALRIETYREILAKAREIIGENRAPDAAAQNGEVK